MSNACFRTHNPFGHRCKNAPRGRYLIPTDGPFVDIGPLSKTFRVVYFKFGASGLYTVTFDSTTSDWACTCPDFLHRQRAEHRTCCKHIQACIDKETGVDRGDNYSTFLEEQVQVQS